MSHGKSASANCRICGKTFPTRELLSGSLVRDNIAAAIRADYPAWTEGDRICQADLARYRAQYVHKLLVAEKGELSELENEVLRSLQTNETLAADVDSDYQDQWTFGERLADRIADFGGSWTFLICFGIFIALWIALNSLVLYFRPVDPFPFILLNLLLSCLAAVQAPIIMMSQNRQEAKDRLRARNDYQVNLKAELEIRHLHEKIDHLLAHHWERLIEIQEVQLDLLNELRRHR